MILTQHTGAFIGPVAKLLGYIMELIYNFTCFIFPESSVLHGNVGLCIILFTLVIYLCLMPLTIRQQKFSKLSQKMQPEIQAVQKKYKGKKDQQSMMAMNEETQQIYQKYGVSASGSCIQLIIQMPILFGLYRVIYNVPAYVSGIKEQFMPVVNGIMGIDGYQDTLSNFVKDINLKTAALNFEGTEVQAANSIIDVLYKIPVTAWEGLKTTGEGAFQSLAGLMDTLEMNLEHMNYFFGLNIANSPMDIIKSGWSAGQYLLVAAGILIPLISAGTQLLNIKLMPTPAAPSTDGNGTADSMASSMKTMNYMMPVFSFVMVFSVPIGMGIYWIAGALIRSVQQILINKHVEKIDLDDLIKKNQAKAKKKREKKGIPENQISSAAKINTRKLSEKAVIVESKENKDEKIRQAQQKNGNAKPGSMAARANLVKDFNEGNRK